MRRVLCELCSKQYDKITEKPTMLYPASPEGEPAEYARVIRGKALNPAPSQRVIYVNDVPHPLDVGHYDCDTCGIKIMPGDDIACLTVWTSRQPEPVEWESKYCE